MKVRSRIWKKLHSRIWQKIPFLQWKAKVKIFITSKTQDFKWWLQDFFDIPHLASFISLSF